MSHIERLESHLIQLGVRHEPVAERTWALYPDTAVPAPIALTLEDPSVLLSVGVLEVTSDTPDREGLFRRLLELNAQLLHSSYGLQGDRVVLSAAHPVDTLDFTELQAIVDDMSMALDNQLDELRPWGGAGASGTHPRPDGSA